MIGKLVAFEGIDQAGKSSLVEGLPAFLPDCRVLIVALGERQSPLGPLLVGTAVKDLSPFLKTYLFASDRAWAYERACLPALEAGRLVLWDRYVDSAIAYRSVELLQRERLIDFEFVRQINRPFRRPDLTFYVDISVETSIERAVQNGTIQPYSLDFLKQVRTRYLAMSEAHGYVVVDGEQSPRAVLESVALILRTRFSDIFGLV